MSATLHSDSWYRVETLHPRLRSHVDVQRRRYRGATWYLLRDTSSGRHHRVSEPAYQIVGRLTGELSVREVWEAVAARLGPATPTQDEVISLLSALHESHLIQSEMTPDVDDLFRRRDQRNRRQRSAAVNPMSFRVPLLDPGPFLDRHAGRVRCLFTRTGLVCWAVAVALGALALMPHWRELMAHGTHLLEMRQLLLLGLVYPFIKAIHELGHAFAVRVWGGEVREMGVALMLLIPVPYVDASAASGFKERHRRVIVSAAGIMVELFLAAMAGLLWLAVEPGLVRDIAFTVMAVGGLSTALFNGNPLMRLDGYYVLSDALEIPNLAARANQSFLAIVQRQLLRVSHVRSSATDAFERWFLPSYCVASNAYRLSVSVLVLFWVASKSVTLALVLGVWMCAMLLVAPARSAILYLLNAPALARRRGIAARNAVLMLTAVALVLFVMPFPSASTAQGVVWFPESAQVRVQASGFVTRVHAQDGSMVEAGAAIVEMENPELSAQLVRLGAREQMLQLRLRQAMRERTVELQSAAQELAAAESELTDTRRKVDGLRLVASAGGQLVLPRGEDLPGSFLKQGTTLGHVVTDEDMVVRVVVTQEQAARVRDGVTAIEVRLAERPDRVLSGRIVHEVPSADTQLHSVALGDRGGGVIRTDPTDPDGLKTLAPVYYFDIGIQAFQPERVGGRTYVRFDHGAEPLAAQVARALRQLFLRRMED